MVSSFGRGFDSLQVHKDGLNKKGIHFRIPFLIYLILPERRLFFPFLPLPFLPLRVLAFGSL